MSGMMSALPLMCVTLALAVSGTPSTDLRADYESSAARCRHGHKGVIIDLHDISIDPEDYLGRLRDRAVAGDELRHHFRHALRGVAGSLSPESLDKVFAEQHDV
jgi:hypothetical protein